MAARVRVELGERSYYIYIGTGLLSQLGPLVREAVPGAGRALVIADAAVATAWQAPVSRSLTGAGFTAVFVTAPAGEVSKTLAVAGQMYEACLDARLERGSCVIALGGGAVGDLAGFVAATYLRGIAFVQVPTTLLAQVDASVGGKVAVNLPRGKNLVGAFHQPRLVVADLAALGTLPPREYGAGLGEVVKHGIIRERGLFEYLEEHAQAVLDQDPAALEAVVERNCRIKAAVVSADEREGGLRAILNLGHTVGHAVEALTGRLIRADGSAGDLLHGEAVSIGLVAATRISRRIGVLAQEDLPDRLEALLTRLGLPTRLPAGLNPGDLPDTMALDKKADGGRIKWVLPVRLGQTQVTQHVPPDDVLAVLQELVPDAE